MSNSFFQSQLDGLHRHSFSLDPRRPSLTLSPCKLELWLGTSLSLEVVWSSSDFRVVESRSPCNCCVADSTSLWSSSSILVQVSTDHGSYRLNHAYGHKRLRTDNLHQLLLYLTYLSSINTCMDTVVYRSVYQLSSIIITTNNTIEKYQNAIMLCQAWQYRSVHEQRTMSA